MPIKVARLVLLGLLFGLGLSPGPARAQAKKGNEVFDKIVRSAVYIEFWENDRLVHFEYGWVADAKRRLVVTNHHVAGDATELRLYFPQYRDGRVLHDKAQYTPARAVTGRVLDTDPRRDLAVVQVDELPQGVRELPLAAKSAAAGEALHLVGNPGASGGGVFVYSTGNVRAVFRKKTGFDTDTLQEQFIDALTVVSQVAANTGDSGGAVTNDKGEAVGVLFGGRTDNANVMTFCVDVAEARAFLNDVCRLLNPATADAGDYFRRGWRHNAARRWDKALADLNRAIELDPKLDRAYGHRGLARVRKGQYREAVADCDEALRLQPDNFHIYNVRAMAYDGLKDRDKAIADYTAAMRLRPGDPALYVNRGASYRAKRDYAAAERDFLEALQLDPTLYLAWYNLGTTYFQGQKYDRAEDALQAARRLNPRDGNTLYWLGAVRKARGRLNQAQPYYLDALALALAPSLAKSVHRFPDRQVKVVNNTSQTLYVYSRYEAADGKGNWLWHPHDRQVKAVKQVVPPGQWRYLADGARVHARRVRLWAESANGKLVWNGDRDRDVVACESPYLARSVDTFTYTFR